MNFSFNLMVAQIVNFVVLLAILSFLFNRFISPFMAKREKELRSGYELVETQKREAEAIRTESQARFAALDKELNNHRELILAQAQRQREEVLEEAQHDAATLMEQARKDIADERRKSLRELHSYIAHLTMAAAEQVLLREIESSDHESFVKEFIDRFDHASAKG